MNKLTSVAEVSFIGDSVEDAAPSGGVLYPPYEARPANDNNPNGWWFVANNAFNTLSFRSKRGAKFTDRETALAIVEKWNSMPTGTKFDIPPDPYVAPQYGQLTDAQMAKYVRSKRLVGNRWVSPIVLPGGPQSGDAIDAYEEGAME